MIEKFTPEELKIIRYELKTLDSTPKHSRKELHDYVGAKIKLIFQDQFSDKYIGYYPGPDIIIPKLSDLCFKNYNKTGERYRVRMNLPDNIFDEYMEMIDEILGVIEKHNKEWE